MLSLLTTQSKSRSTVSIRLNKYAITEDQEGNLSHAWDVEDPEAYEEQQIEEEPDEEVFDFESDIFGQLGGQQNYNRLIEFAANNWTHQTSRQ